MAAAFLEAIQLAFQVGFLNQRKEFGLIEKYSDEDKKLLRSVTRLGNLNRAITNYENKFNVKYRPDRPNFNAMKIAAMETAAKTLQTEIEERATQGEEKPKDWVF